MSNTQNWGRRESWIWPPRGFYYTYGAVFIAAVLCSFFLYLRFEFGISPLQRYYLPYVIRAWASEWRISPSRYQLVYVAGPREGSHKLRSILTWNLEPLRRRAGSRCP